MNDGTVQHFFKLYPKYPASDHLENKTLKIFTDGSTYESRVSFDTFDNKDATDISFTLVSKHKDYAYSRRSRTFLCGTDQNDYSEFALEWLVEELVEDGDEIVCLRVVDKDSKISSNISVEQGIYKTEARKLLEHIQEKNEEDKAISLVLEFAVGKVPETIQRMVRLFIHSTLSFLMLIQFFSDQDLRSGLPNRWNTRQVFGRYPKSPAWLREQVLSSELARSRCGRPP